MSSALFTRFLLNCLKTYYVEDACDARSSEVYKNKSKNN